MSLIERIEQAEGPSRDLLEEAFDSLRGPEPTIWAVEYEVHTPEYSAWIERGWRFGEMLDAEAWESAALMLVPEGYLLQSLSQTSDAEQEEYTGVGPLPKWSCALLRQDCAGYRNRNKYWGGLKQGDGNTPALALAAAALKAKEAEHGQVR